MHINEIVNQSFYKYPKWLLKIPKDKLSWSARIVYMVMFDRLSLSEKNGWYDEDGQVYIYFTYEKLIEETKIKSRATIKKAKDELRDLNLIKEVYQGKNRPNKIYVFGGTESVLQGVQKMNYGSSENELQGVQKMNGSKTNNIKTNISRLSNQEELEDTSYLDIGTPPPPPKKSMDFGQFVKTSGLKVNQSHVQRLLEYIGVDNMDLDLVKLAITKTVDQGIEAPAYTFSILDNWKSKGITTVEQALKEQEEFEARKSNKQHPTAQPSPNSIPDWSQPNFKEPTLDEMWEDYVNGSKE